MSSVNKITHIVGERIYWTVKLMTVNAPTNLSGCGVSFRGQLNDRAAYRRDFSLFDNFTIRFRADELVNEAADRKLEGRFFSFFQTRACARQSGNFDYGETMSQTEMVVSLDRDDHEIKIQLSRLGEPPGAAWVVGETPIGSVNGSNASFTARSNFVPETLSVIVNGLIQKKIADFNTSGVNQILFSESPQTGDKLQINYQKGEQ